MNMVPLIATVGVVGVGAAVYYFQFYCPDAAMERNDDGDCVCGEGYYLDPDDDGKCIALPSTEATECKGVLVNGVYIYDAGGDDLTTILEDESKDIQIDCLLCNACEGSSKQAQDGRCLRCKPASIQQEYRDGDDGFMHGTSSGTGAAGSGGEEGQGWIQDYELEEAAKTTPANPISADYTWTVETVDDNAAENYESHVGPLYTPYTNTTSTSGYITVDPSSCPGQSW